MAETAPETPPPVSVVIPAHDRAGTIEAAIRSVLDQSFGDFELIVVDDASSDDTAEAVRAISDPRLRLLVHKTNRGAGAARNTGIAAARGEWVAFQDSDDEWLPSKLAKQMARLAGAEAGPDTIAAYCGMIVLGTPEAAGTAQDRGAGRTLVQYRPAPGPGPVEGDLAAALLGRSFISTQTLVARRSALRAIDGFDESLRALEDWDLSIRLARLGRILLVDEPLVIQRYSANSLTRDDERQRAMRQRIVEKHGEAFAAHPRALALRLHQNAGGLRRRGQWREALPFLLRACRLDPARPRYWAALGYTALGALTRR